MSDLQVEIVCLLICKLDNNFLMSFSNSLINIESLTVQVHKSLVPGVLCDFPTIPVVASNVTNPLLSLALTQSPFVLELSLSDDINEPKAFVVVKFRNCDDHKVLVPNVYNSDFFVCMTSNLFSPAESFLFLSICLILLLTIICLAIYVIANFKVLMCFRIEFKLEKNNGCSITIWIIIIFVWLFFASYWYTFLYLATKPNFLPSKGYYYGYFILFDVCSCLISCVSPLCDIQS